MSQHAKFKPRIGWLLAALGATIALLLGWFASAIWSAQEAESEAHAAIQAQQTAEAQTQALAQAITEACQRGDVLVDSQSVCPKADQLADSVNGAHDNQPVGGYDLPPMSDIIAANFRTYCQEGNCRGADGQTPSPSELAKIFADYCATTGQCRGEDGQPATVEQISAAVAGFCAGGQCRGEPGPTGPPGNPGADGSGPESFSFTDQTGTTHLCIPDPPGAATYRCTPQTP